MSSIDLARLSRRCLALAVYAALVLPFTEALATTYPLKIDNCGRELTFDRAPPRVVSVGQSGTEILLALGLADHIAGTAVWFGPVPPEYAAINAKIPRLADNDPSFEAVVGREPGLVTADFEWHIGANGSVGTRDQFAKLGIPTYIAPADCVEKDNSGGGDGVRKQLFTMDLVYQEIGDLAAIFDVEARGDELIRDLKRREAEAVASVATSKANRVPVVFWFSSKDVQGEAFVAGKNGVPAYIMQKLGARNVIETNEEWPMVSWESIVGSNPAVIVMAKMDRRRYGADDIGVKTHFLETDPVVQKLDAVQQRHFVVMDVQSMQASMRAIDGIEALAHGIKSFGLAD